MNSRRDEEIAASVGAHRDLSARSRRASPWATKREPGRSSSSGLPSSLSTWPSSAAAAPPDATAAPWTDRPARCHSVVPHSGQAGQPACPASCSQVNSGRYQHRSRIASGITGGLQAPTPSSVAASDVGRRCAQIVPVCARCPVSTNPLPGAPNGGSRAMDVTSDCYAARLAIARVSDPSADSAPSAGG